MLEKNGEPCWQRRSRLDRGITICDFCRSDECIVVVHYPFEVVLALTFMLVRLSHRILRAEEVGSVLSRNSFFLPCQFFSNRIGVLSRREGSRTGNKPKGCQIYVYYIRVLHVVSDSGHWREVLPPGIPVIIRSAQDNA